MSDFTFLTEEQIFGSNQIDVIRKRGTKAAITDFSILLGAYVSELMHILWAHQALPDVHQIHTQQSSFSRHHCSR